MPVWRNFFLGSEMTKGPWPIQRLDIDRMKKTADEELRNMGIVLDDLDQPIGTLSGGQRQSVAIARAVYFGARVLILDEPTAALGVKQSGVVLKYIAAARDRGLGVIFITHNPHHAYMVGDHFSVLRLGTLELSAARSEVSLEELTNHMAGGAELAALKHELAQVRGVDVDELPEAEDLKAPVTASPKGPPDMTAPLDRIRVGSAPDSWGVWFPDDPQQVPWERFLDEVSEAGYSWIELGPYGYLSTDPARLTAEIDKRDLKVSAGTVFTGLHRGPSVCLVHQRPGGHSRHSARPRTRRARQACPA